MPHRTRSARLVVVVVLATLMLAACGGGNDNPALGGDVPYTVGSGTTVPRHPPVPVSTLSLNNVEYPHVSATAKARVLNAALLADAQSLVSRKVACAVSTLRADSAVLSFRWTCAGKSGLTATFDTVSGQAVALGDLFKAGYLDQLSPTAVTQLQAGGASLAQARRAAPPTDAAFGNWAVDDQSLEVTFTLRSQPVTISFPLASLSSIISPAGALGH